MNPWVILAAVLFYFASLAGVGYWQREDGAASTRADYEARDNEELIAANAAIVKLEAHNRQVENEHAEMIAAIGEAHEKDRDALEALRIRDVAAAKSGALVLRVPGGCEAPRNPAPEGSAPAAVRDGAEGSQLPAAVASDLFALADDADRNTVQLGACQAVVRSYLKE